MHFSLKRPCDNCPFRHDITFYLSPERTQEILDAITRQDQTFACHKTTHHDDWEDDDDGESYYMPSGNEQHCAGALILLEKLERPNQLMRIAERLGMYDRHKLDMDAPVFETPQKMLARMRKLHRNRA